MTLAPEVMAIAQAQAAKDRDLLAKLRRAGLVRKHSTGNADPRFVADIEARAFPPRVVNLAIRPKAKKGKRR